MITLFKKIFNKVGMVTGPSCEAVNNLLDDYLDGLLDNKTNQKFERHMDLCPKCKVHLDQYKETIQLVKEAESPDIPEALATHTMAFLKKEFTCSTENSASNGASSSESGSVDSTETE